MTKGGKQKYNKVYSKRSKNWRIITVQEDKTFDFWVPLTVGILQKRVDDDESILTKTIVSADHPKKIASSIAMKPVPSTADLVQQNLSRFANQATTAKEPVQK